MRTLHLYPRELSCKSLEGQEGCGSSFSGHMQRREDVGSTIGCQRLAGEAGSTCHPLEAGRLMGSPYPQEVRRLVGHPIPWKWGGCGGYPSAWKQGGWWVPILGREAGWVPLIPRKWRGWWVPLLTLEVGKAGGYPHHPLEARGPLSACWGPPLPLPAALSHIAVHAVGWAEAPV